MTINKPERTVNGTTSELTFANRFIHFLIRLGINRGKYRINPGLYALGNPITDSPVFVTANYALSFDALRTSLTNIDCYILVLDTKGINVWCAAGKGTFGTEELTNRINVTSLNQVVKHRKLILPQLGAPGVAAHKIKTITGFHVVYGPVRASDIPEFMKIQEATPEMRRVSFNLKDRFLLVPVEFVSMLIPLLIATTILYFIGGILTSISVAAAILAGVVLFPILLPWIPTHNFSTKGFILGGLITIPFALSQFFPSPDPPLWQSTSRAVAFILTLPAITAYLSLNFTGATTFTSRSGVKREIYKYIPIMAWTFGGGLVLSITITLIEVVGG
jgi:hypothetical protein